MKSGFVYLLTNKNNTVLYVGVTSNLVERIEQHRTKKYPKKFYRQIRFVQAGVLGDIQQHWRGYRKGKAVESGVQTEED